MLRVPSKLLSRYENILEINSIPLSHRRHYKRWLCLYLDFCYRYNFPPTETSGISSFDQKLADKNQAPWQRQQAQMAIALYHSLIAQPRPAHLQGITNQRCNHDGNIIRPNSPVAHNTSQSPRGEPADRQSFRKYLSVSTTTEESNYRSKNLPLHSQPFRSIDTGLDRQNFSW